jgi:hypothetical protein
METLAYLQESLAQFMMVIDLAIEYQQPSAASRLHWLVTRSSEVKNGKSGLDQTDGFVKPNPRVIGTAMV